jgi:AcrR family transcriptional regulator
MPRIVKTASVRRSEIVDAARRLFAEHGYDATSVNHIIAAVGISKGAFYHHFAAKEDLLEALAARYAEESAHYARQVLEDETLDSFARLTLFLERLRRRKVETAAEVRATFAPVLRKENVQLYYRTHAAITAVLQPILTQIIAEGVAERTFDTADPKAAAEVILHLAGTTRALASAAYEAGGGQQTREVTAELLRKLQYLGTVVDRILGLPEGSVEFSDAASVEAIIAALHAPTRAA